MLDTRTVLHDNGRKPSLVASEAIEKERQRKFLVQVQKSRILAAAQILQATKMESTRSGVVYTAPHTVLTDAKG